MRRFVVVVLGWLAVAAGFLACVSYVAKPMRGTLLIVNSRQSPVLVHGVNVRERVYPGRDGCVRLPLMMQALRVEEYAGGNQVATTPQIDGAQSWILRLGGNERLVVDVIDLLPHEGCA